jgi:F-type H+-transporting ATPase subunit gamma
MPSLLDLRRRIRSVHNTQQITKAMKTVSTAKFKKAQRTVVEGRPHWHETPDLLARVSGWAGRTAHPLFAVRPERRVHVLVVTSDKGLCGAFNSSLMSRAAGFVSEKRSAAAEVSLVLVGRKAANFFKGHDLPVERVISEHVDKLPRAEIEALGRLLMRRYVFQETDGVYVIYNEFKSVLAPRITITRLLPVVPEPAAEPSPEPEWEPGLRPMLDAFLPRFVEDQLAHALAESQAAEQAARMMAMDNASKNAEELIGDLVLVMNKIRQAGITKELLEIMTAVEALKKG